MLVPAIDRVNVPKRRIPDNNIGNYNFSRVHKFNEIRSSKLKSSPPPHVPPDISLAINCPILTYEKSLKKQNGRQV